MRNLRSNLPIEHVMGLLRPLLALILVAGIRQNVPGERMKVLNITQNKEKQR